MRQRFEGAVRPGATITFDCANTMHGAYAEATPEQKHTAALHAVTEARDLAEGRTFLDMLGLYAPRPQEA